MRFFLAILVGIIIASAFTSYIHDLYLTSSGEIELSDYFMSENNPAYRLPNTIIRQYLLALGEFDIDQIAESPIRTSTTFQFALWTFII